MRSLVVVTQTIEVSVDESKFTEAWMAEFRESFFQFYTLGQHLCYLAQLYARGLVDDFGEQFIEGYGPAADMGIKFRKVDGDEEILAMSVP